MVRVQCPRCGWRFAVEEAMRGKSDRCPQCATPVPVPSGVAGEAPAVPVVVRAATIIRTPLSDADDRLRPEFDRYLDALAAAVGALNIFPDTGPPAELYVSVKLNPGGRADVSAIVDPGDLAPDAAAVGQLFAAVFAVKAPVLRDAATEATLVFAIRGGTGATAK